MTTDRPKLHPGHRHRWAESTALNMSPLVTCIVCGFTSPRSLANLDGAMLNDAVYDGPDGIGEDRTPTPADAAVVEFAMTASPLREDFDTDIRCPHHTPAGQCLDHQGHLGDHQYPQETR